MRTSSTKRGTAVVRIVAVMLVGLLGGLPGIPSRGRPVPSVHGDVPPPGVDLNRVPSTTELRQRVTGSAEQRAQSQSQLMSFCAGDGVSGNRVQLVYAHAADVPSRYVLLRDLLQRVAANADDAVNYSAAPHGVGRRIRYHTDEGCVPTVAEVTLSRAGDNSFDSMVGELTARGYQAPDRKYLVFMEGNGAVGEKICGLGQVYSDDEPGQTNLNNGGPTFARIDAPCWGYAESVELHELMHMLGAVQPGAPHHTRLAHCTDEADRLCYADEPGVALRQVCPPGDEQLLDCRDDDYFNPRPATGSYLATHWNTANSSFLEEDVAPPAKPSVSVRVPQTVLPGAPAGLEARVSVPLGRSARITWSTTLPGCSFANASAPRTAFWCSATTLGWGQVTATVTDSLGLTVVAAADFSTLLPSARRRTVLRIAPSARAVRPGARVTIDGTLADPQTGLPVIGVPTVLYARRAGARSWTRVASAVTASTGKVRLAVRVRNRSSYQLTSSAGAVWAGAASADVSVWTGG